MAKLIGEIKYTGKIGDLSAYTRRGTKGVILRSKGGASALRIATGSEFARTRENNKEWGGASTSGKMIRHAMIDVRHLADPNLTGKATALCRAILQLDTVCGRGKRPVQISAHKYLLTGFNLNDTKTFASIVRYPIEYSINREQCKANIRLPDLIPGINFFPQTSLPMFRFILQLGIVPDMVYDGPNKYKPANAELKLSQPFIKTDYYPSAVSFSNQSLELVIPDNNLDETGTLLLTIGIEFGTIGLGNTVKAIPHAGAAVVLGAA